MEDEECLPENGSLKTYLEELGFDDFQLKKSVSDSNIIRFEHSLSVKSKEPHSDLIDEDVIRKIEILVSTQMLFQEDVKNIENFLSNFAIKKHGMLKSMFQGKIGFYIIFLGIFLYWIMGSYVIYIASSFYAYKACDYLWTKNFTQKRLKKLASILQSNYDLLSKTIKFINDNDKLLKCSDFVYEKKSDDFSSGFEFYNTFKNDFNQSLNETINVFTNSTKKLMEKLPLHDYIENPQYYICNNFNEGSKPSDISKLYQIYMLVQSEFLHRFILTLIPHLNVSSQCDFKELNRILTESCISLLKIKNSLHKKFKYIFFNGIHLTKTPILNSFVRPKNHVLSYEEELVSSIHEVSNTFQNLLVKSRMLEENLKQNKLPSPEMENDLINLQTELNLCQKSISDGFILLKKASKAKEPEEENIEKIKVMPEKDATLKKVVIPVGYTDLDPDVEDEIFEAYFEEKNGETHASNFDDWDFEDLVKRKREKEYSKKVINELKAKLIEKADDWEKREAKLISQKYNSEKCNSTNDTKFSKKNRDSANANMPNESASKEPIQNGYETYVKKTDRNSLMNLQENGLNTEKNRKPKGNVIVIREENRNERNRCSNAMSNEEFHENCLALVNKGFLADIGVAHQRILQKKTGENEECFGDSESDNSEDT